MKHRQVITIVILLPCLSIFGPSAVAQASINKPTVDRCLADIGGQVYVDDAEFIMGNDATYPEEGPAHPVSVSAFWLDSHEVTNAQFSQFVVKTGYVTTAERPPNPSDWPADVPSEFLEAGSTLFTHLTPGEPVANWWAWVPGTNWLHPNGPGSDIEGKGNYPVIHVSYADAEAYAEWVGRSLPSEAQFELAARNKRDGLFAWDGDELAPHGHHYANTWQGEFPLTNDTQDMHSGLAPVGCFEANDYGAYDLIGNVWEWTSNWYAENHQPDDSVNPEGPAPENSHSLSNGDFPVKVIKGGSYLCAENYCLRYRPAARQAQDTGMGTSHIGFRTVLNIQ